MGDSRLHKADRAKAFTHMLSVPPLCTIGRIPHTSAELPSLVGARWRIASGKSRLAASES
jgi:hypothetical protein